MSGTGLGPGNSVVNQTDKNPCLGLYGYMICPGLYDSGGGSCTRTRLLQVFIVTTMKMRIRWNKWERNDWEEKGEQ